MRHWSNIADAGNEYPSGLKRPDGGLSPCSRSPDEYCYLPQSIVHSFSCSAISRSLGSKGRGFPRADEADCSRTSPRNHVTGFVCKRYQRVIERRLDISPSYRNRLTHSSPSSWFSWHLIPRIFVLTCPWLCLGYRVPPTGDWHSTSALCSSICSRSLTSHR